MKTTKEPPELSIWSSLLQKKWEDYYRRYYPRYLAWEIVSDLVNDLFVWFHELAISLFM